MHYCAEQFENDGSPASTIVKVVKRTMAGEYSRELSAKVFHGACNLIRLGYKQGGTAGYGLRRMLIDQAGQQKTLLKMGEHKSIQTDRVVLVPGPDEEVKTVRWMYHVFVEEGKNEAEIAVLLNGRNILTDFGRAWTRGTVHQVLTNEKYIGNNVYHRTSFKLKRKHVVNPPDKWIRADGKFVSIVEPVLFLRAQEIILTRSRKLTNDEMLDRLRSVLQKHGHICGIIIDEMEDMPSSAAFRHRFGSLVTAYRLIGYDPGIDYAFVEINRRLRRQHPALVSTVISGIEALGAGAQWNPDLELLRVNSELWVSIVLCRHIFTKAGFSRWVAALAASTDYTNLIAPLIDPARLATLGPRGANPRIQKAVAHLEAARKAGLKVEKVAFEAVAIAGYTNAAAAKLTSAALVRNHDIADKLGCLDAAGLDDMRHGKSPTIKKGPYKGQELSVDHIIPKDLVPELDCVVANLEFLPLKLNMSKNDRIGERQRSHARKLYEAGLLSAEGLKKVQSVKR